MVLLRALHQLGHRKLIVVHLNHRLRGRASGADAAFVRRLATSLGLQCAVESEDVQRRAKRIGLSIEHAAREARYAFFAKVAKHHRCARLLLAHHADDQVETVLMNLFRGTGVTGLSGMANVSERWIDGRTLTLLRPLLSVWRNELETFASEQDWSFREDSSNADPQFLRNRVRHEVIPYLKEVFGRDVRTTMTRLAMQCQAENTFLQSQIVSKSSADVLNVASLRQLPLGLQRRLMHQWLLARHISNVSFDLVERSLTLIQPGASVAKINLPKDRHLRRRAGKLFID